MKKDSVKLLALLNILDKSHQYVDITWNRGHNNYIVPIYRAMIDWQDKPYTCVSRIDITPNNIIVIITDYVD